MPDVDLSTIIQLIVRHVLTSVGLWLAGHGYLDSSAVQGFVGAGMMIGGILWSIGQKDGVAWLGAEKARLEKLVAIYSKQLAARGQQPGPPTVSPGSSQQSQL